MPIDYGDSCSENKIEKCSSSPYYPVMDIFPTRQTRRVEDGGYGIEWIGGGDAALIIV